MEIPKELIIEEKIKRGLPLTDDETTYAVVAREQGQMKSEIETVGPVDSSYYLEKDLKENPPSKTEAFVGGFSRGAEGLYEGAKQFGKKAWMEGVNYFSPNTYSEKDFKRADQPVRDLMKRYAPLGKYSKENQDSMMFGASPYELGKFTGELSASSPLMLVPGGQATMPARMGAGAVAGGALGLATPVEKEGSFWVDKLITTGAYSGLGAVGGELTHQAVANVAPAVIKWLGKNTPTFTRLLQKAVGKGQKLFDQDGDVTYEGKMFFKAHNINPKEVSSGVKAEMRKLLQGNLQNPGTVTPEASLRIARAKPIGVKLSAGQAGRRRPDAEFEDLMKRDPEVQAHDSQNIRAVTRELDSIQKDIGGRTTSRDRTGQSVAEQIFQRRKGIDKAEKKAYEQIVKMYKRKAINVDRLEKYLKEEIRLGNDVGGNLKSFLGVLREVRKGNKGRNSKKMLIGQVEELRKKMSGRAEGLKKSIEPTAKEDRASIVKAMRKLEEQVKSELGSDVYAPARKIMSDLETSFDNRLAKDIVRGKYGQRMEKVVSDVYRASPQELAKFKTIMHTQGDKGKKAWKDLAGQIFADIRERITKGIDTAGDGRQLKSAQALAGEIQKLSEDTADVFGGAKAKMLWGNDVKGRIKTLLEVMHDLELPVEARNFSGTTQHIKALLENIMGSSSLEGALARAGGKAIKGNMARKRLQKSLQGEAFLRDQGLTPDLWGVSNVLERPTRQIGGLLAPER